MNQTKKKIRRKSEVPATLKEAVQGRKEPSNSIVLGVDIKQFKHSIDLFKYSLDYAEAIVDTVREPLVILNKELKVITANRAFYRTFNLLPEKLENRPFYELGDGELDIPAFRKLLMKVLKHGTSFDDFEIDYRVPKKGRRTLLLNARKFYRQVNSTQTILLAIEDVTLQRQYEREKDEFASVIMHELKTPVTTISAYLQLLQGHLSKREDKKLIEYANVMSEQVLRLTSLINGLLNSSQIRAVGFQYKEGIFDIGELITQTISEVQAITKTHKISQKGAVARYVKGDRLRIGEVLINLLTNAIKYSPNSDKIVVSTALKGGKVIIGVEDFGIGISKINKKKVFKRFFKINKTNRDPYDGVGLGLDISSQIVHHHKGKMWIAEKDGNGSLFNFSLPTQRSYPSS